MRKGRKATSGVGIATLCDNLFYELFGLVRECTNIFLMIERHVEDRSVFLLPKEIRRSKPVSALIIPLARWAVLAPFARLPTFE